MCAFESFLVFFILIAVVSGSMEHDDKFDVWWESDGAWYMDKGIQKEDFQEGGSDQLTSRLKYQIHLPDWL